jgi:DNA-binding FadR family transcriptional regulator
MNQSRDGTLGHLKELIANGEGRLPPERALAAKIGVSRRKIREALELLEKDGQIQRRRGAGTFVATAADDPGDLFRRAIQLTNPVEVLEVRLSVEPTLARFAAIRASKSDIETLNFLTEATDAAPTPAAWELADAAFHHQIALMSRNALFVAVFDAVVAAIEDVAWHGVRETAHCSKNKAIYVGFHRDIAAAVASRDAARAEELMFAHLKHVQDQLLAATAPPPANSRRLMESSP